MMTQENNDIDVMYLSNRVRVVDLKGKTTATPVKVEKEKDGK